MFLSGYGYSLLQVKCIYVCYCRCLIYLGAHCISFRFAIIGIAIFATNEVANVNIPCFTGYVPYTAGLSIAIVGIAFYAVVWLGGGLYDFV